MSRIIRNLPGRENEGQTWGISKRGGDQPQKRHAVGVEHRAIMRTVSEQRLVGMPRQEEKSSEQNHQGLCLSDYRVWFPNLGKILAAEHFVFPGKILE